MRTTTLPDIASYRPLHTASPTEAPRVRVRWLTSKPSYTFAKTQIKIAASRLTVWLLAPLRSEPLAIDCNRLLRFCKGELEVFVRARA